MASYLLTYLIHSTLLLGGALLVCGALGLRRLGLQEALVKAALLGALVTAALPQGWAGRSLHMSLPSADAVAVPTAIVSAAGPELPLRPAVAPDLPLPAPAPPAPAHLEVALSLLVGGWVLGALVGLALLLRDARRLRLRLGRRQWLRAGRLAEILARIRRIAHVTAPVRLSRSESVGVPIALGIVRPEICVPPRVESELPADLQEGLLAHELGHLVRRDPLWAIVCLAIERVFFLQPLNRLARRRLEVLGDLRADDWAAVRTRQAPALARCLARVAEWNLAPSGLGLAAVAGDRGVLPARVRRLLQKAARDERGVSPVLGAIVVIAVLAVGLIAPAVDGAAGPVPGVVALAEDEKDVPPPPPDPPAAPEAPAAAEAPEPPPPPEAAAAPEAPAPPDLPEPPESPEPAMAPEPPMPPPAPMAAPAPALAPAPAPRPAPRPRERQEATPDSEREREIRGRIAEVEAEIAALTAHAMPDAATLERLQEAAKRMAEADLSRTQARAAKMAEKQAALQAGQMARQAQQLAKMAEMGPALAERAARLAELAQRAHEADLKADEKEALEAERRQLHEEMRRLAEQARPSAEELARLREEARRVAEEMRPSREELERMRTEMKRAHEEAARVRAEAGQLHEGLQREQQEKLRALVDELRALHHELQKTRGHNTD